MNLRSTDEESPEINLTSLIDVVLLLLVFFMLTTSFVRESQITIRLPEASGAPVVEVDKQRLEITVTPSGTFLVNGRALVDNRPETLRAAILKVKPEVEERKATISADAEAAHQDVVTAMDIAGQLGFVEVSIATVASSGASP